ncbi:hypothetical protein [Tardiphaga sp.]|uniref:hypothetical protein n=1 Tax=Tardiphaga sp. TaxID=1926292 RepID=UPI002623FC27|nr:hypothetical protein [Tardiphaga sp.]
MHAIANAISARNKLIRSMIMSVLKFFGAQEIEAPRKNASPMTMQDFDLLFS